MVKFLLPKGDRSNPEPARVTAAVTITGDSSLQQGRLVRPVKFLVKFRRFKFDENSARIRFDFGPNARNIANDSFRHVCYV